jgi:type II secretory pathway pseudopilin PulG
MNAILRRLSDREEGFTLVEVIVASSVLMLVLVIFLSTLISVQRTASNIDKRSQNQNQARLAVEALDRQVRSANYIYEPTSAVTGITTGYGLKVYTQNNAPTRNPAPGYLCTLFQITTGNQLQVRTWPPLQPTKASPWLTLATGVVNRTSNTTAFSLDTDAARGYTTGGGYTTSRTINVVLLANLFPSTLSTGTIRTEVALTGRNTSYGFPPTACSTNPA